MYCGLVMPAARPNRSAAAGHPTTCGPRAAGKPTGTAAGRLIAITLFFLGLLISNPMAQAQQDGSPAAAEIDPKTLLDKYTHQTVVDADGQQHAYRLLFPDGYDPAADRVYPLVLLLHGAGERGDDNEAQLVHGAAEFARPDRQASFACFVLAPQVPRDKRWAEVDWGQPTGKGQFPQNPSPSMAAAVAAVEHWIASGRVDADRVYVTGISMGGYGTWYAAAYRNDLFAAAVPICGGGDPDWASRYQGLPIWNFHGDADRAVPVIRSREMIDALQAAGQQPAAIYTEYPGAGHNVWTETYRRDDLFQWLFSQRRSAP